MFLIVITHIGRVYLQVVHSYFDYTFSYSHFIQLSWRATFMSGWYLTPLPSRTRDGFPRTGLRGAPSRTTCDYVYWWQRYLLFFHRPRPLYLPSPNILRRKKRGTKKSQSKTLSLSHTHTLPRCRGWLRDRASLTPPSHNLETIKRRPSTS